MWQFPYWSLATVLPALDLMTARWAPPSRTNEEQCHSDTRIACVCLHDHYLPKPKMLLFNKMLCNNICPYLFIPLPNISLTFCDFPIANMSGSARLLLSSHLPQLLPVWQRDKPCWSGTGWRTTQKAWECLQFCLPLPFLNELSSNLLKQPLLIFFFFKYRCNSSLLMQPGKPACQLISGVKTSALCCMG